MSRDALVVGIDCYQHLPNLQAPARDAESVAQCFESFGECRVLRMPEVIRAQKPAVHHQGLVTTQMLETALIRLFKPSGKNVPQTAIFYYSGHGLQRNAGIQEGYLATSDANPTTGNYGLSLHWLRRLLQESPVRQRVILLDCCNSGEFFNALEADPGAKAGTDRLFMAASREYEEAYESLEGNHSVFTQALLTALNPYNIKGGLVNGHSLTDQVNRQLKGELQQPLFESSGAEIVLTRTSGSAQAVPSPGRSTLDRLKGWRYRFCPFPGLAPFEMHHADLFFGREAITQSLINQTQSAPFCALVGASGIGKTSILQAGLRASLVKPRANVRSQWQVRYLSLGSAPLQDLATAFVDDHSVGISRAEQLQRAEQLLRQGVGGFMQLLQALVETSMGSDTHMVLIVDQLEALFSSTVPDIDRQLVMDCLTAAARQDRLPFHLVVGLRTSACDHLEAFPVFQTLVDTHSLEVPAMTYDQLKATIVGPLDKMELGYDANLVYTLLLDVVGAPGDLASLQMALKTLWYERESDPDAQTGPRLTLNAYAQMGGIRRLLSQRASDVYETLPPMEQAIARRIFLSLCELGDGTTLTRRQVQLPELVTATFSQEQVQGVLDTLTAARLVVAQTQTQTHFDVAHESLVRTWPLIQEWLHGSHSQIRHQRTLEAAAQEWHQQQRPNHPDYFLTKSRLLEAKAFRAKNREALSLQAEDYLQACETYAQRSHRKVYLMRLLIPLSMATGMLTAYSHSLLTQPSMGLVTASARVSTMEEGPTFQLVAPEPSPRPELPVGSLGSPQMGMARTDIVQRASSRLALGQWQAAPTGPLREATPALLSVLEQGHHSIQSWSRQGQGATSPPSSAPALGEGLQGNTYPHHQVVDPVAQLDSPDNPDVIIQIWCTRQATPTCFTSTAPRPTP
jgi:hypothetical protein